MSEIMSSPIPIRMHEKLLGLDADDHPLYLDKFELITESTGTPISRLFRIYANAWAYIPHSSSTGTWRWAIRILSPIDLNFGIYNKISGEWFEVGLATKEALWHAKFYVDPNHFLLLHNTTSQTVNILVSGVKYDE